jgi:hypothetical protein
MTGTKAKIAVWWDFITLGIKEGVSPETREGTFIRGKDRHNARELKYKLVPGWLKWGDSENRHLSVCSLGTLVKRGSPNPVIQRACSNTSRMPQHLWLFCGD